jgi:LPXTG-site transpeptidase (sortase) family protein
MTAAATCAAAGIGLIAYPYYWKWREANGAANLMQHAPVPTDAADQACAGSTEPSQLPNDAVRGILDIPAIQLKVPVLQGIGANVLNVAVGHVPTSSWPDQMGTSVLAAHDIGHFSRIGQLKPGDQITFASSCREWTYTITGHEVVQEGDPLPEVAGKRIALITCWPIDSMFRSSERYLVLADLTSVTTIGDAGDPLSNAAQQVGSRLAKDPGALLKMDIPQDLVREGVTIDDWDVPEGYLSVDEHLDPAYAQSTLPFWNAVYALRTYIAASRALDENKTADWQHLAPTIPWNSPEAQALRGRRLTYLAPVSELVRGTGTDVTSIVFSAPVRIDSGPAVGTYRLTAVLSPDANGYLRLTSFQLTGGRLPQPSASPTSLIAPQPTPSRPRPTGPSPSPTGTPSSSAHPTRRPTPSPRPTPSQPPWRQPSPKPSPSAPSPTSTTPAPSPSDPFPSPS